jgi:uncharacterized protein YodC (DUF2158 family)
MSAPTEMEFNVLAFTKRLSTAIALTLGIALSVPLSVPALSDSASSNTAMQNRPAAPFQRGDLVRLRSGGPMMTVDSVRGDQVDCFWTDPNGQVNAESFPIGVLQKS